MRKYVITESELCAGLCREEDLENHRVIEPDIKVVHTFVSDSWTEAMQTFNDFYGYGTYNPPVY